LIHYLTVHFHSTDWIDTQLIQVRRHSNDDVQVWASLDGIARDYASSFDHVYQFAGEHPDKLNALADEVSAVAEPDDILVFIDGDAFPVDDVRRSLRKAFERHPLVGVQRLESLGDCQPHPCFTATTVGFWNDAALDWSRGGRPWINNVGYLRFDAGARILVRLEELGVSWLPLLRSNKRDLHPVLFGIYGDLVYHHGSSFRRATTQVDRYQTGMLENPGGLRSVPRLLATRRRENKNAAISRKLFTAIREDPDVVKRIFLDDAADAFAI